MRSVKTFGRLVPSVFVLLVFLLLYQGTARHDIPEGLIFALVVYAVGFLVYRIRTSAEQGRRDREMLRLEKEVEAGDQRLFYLYLRPFTITSRLLLRNPKYPKWDIPRQLMRPDGFVDLEYILQQALESTGANLLALGKPGETLGAGRVLSQDQDWEDRFEKFARSADGILVIPSASRGTLWELQRIVEAGYLDKSVFIQPARISPAEWTEIRNATASFGLILADHQPKGQMFKVLCPGEVISARMPGSAQPVEDGESIQRLKLAGSPPR